jgi:hypothetical protein
VHQHEIRVENRLVTGVVEVEVEDLAVAAPVAAEIEQNAAVRGGRGLERGGQVGSGLPGIGIDRAIGGVCRAGGKGQERGEDNELDGLDGEPPGCSQDATSGVRRTISSTLCDNMELRKRAE